VVGQSKAETTTVRNGDEVTVTLRYKDLDKTIRGSPESVLREISGFLTTIVPNIDLASKISLSVDLQELIADCHGVLAVTAEDIVVLRGLEKLTDRELVLLNLVRGRIGSHIGKTKSDATPSAKLVELVKKNPGTIAGRLSELANEGLVERVGKGEYRATTLGLQRFREQILPKMKAGM
jgi:hypothetical protein